jgi:short subunit dehydrogenase-like uncharacterized protein
MTWRVITRRHAAGEWSYLMGTEVWILGGTGRSGHAIAAELASQGVSPVLVGRDAARLTEAAARAGQGRTVVADSVEAMAAQIRRQQPAVVINTIGPFTQTAAPIATACLQAGHYVDLANDLAAVSVLLAMTAAAATAGRTLVTGAGFGVTATESVVVRLCQDRPGPDRVRVDMVPSLEMEAGAIGEALAGTILDGLPGVDGGGRYDGRCYADGRLVRSRIGGDAIRLTLPDGSQVTTASIPLGELMAAQRASGAPSVVAASSEAPASPAVRAVLPLATALLAIGPVRAFAKRRLAAVKFKARERPREHSWGHARLQWADGSTAEGWLRVGEAQAFTGAVPAEVARRLLAGAGKPGAYTPAALFGPSLAEACGGEYLIGDLCRRPGLACRGPGLTEAQADDFCYPAGHEGGDAVEQQLRRVQRQDREAVRHSLEQLQVHRHAGGGRLAGEADGVVTQHFGVPARDQQRRQARAVAGQRRLRRGGRVGGA